MIRPDDVRSLSDFQRNTKSHIRRLKKSGRPVVLTVNGRASVVIQDAAAYQNLLERAERAETVAALRTGLDEMRRGKGRPFEEVAARLGAKYLEGARARARRRSA